MSARRPYTWEDVPYDKDKEIRQHLFVEVTEEGAGKLMTIADEGNVLLEALAPKEPGVWLLFMAYDYYDGNVRVRLHKWFKAGVSIEEFKGVWEE